MPILITPADIGITIAWESSAVFISVNPNHQYNAKLVAMLYIASQYALFFLSSCNKYAAKIWL
jgi:hypothetical protein